MSEKLDILDDEMLSKEELIKMLKVSTSMVNKLLRETDFPRYHLGRRILFRKSEVFEWMKKNCSVDPENSKSENQLYKKFN
ncbi:MAG TPA: helix-turn-helix domain-containing protein [Thermodesulfovibrio thiophilus]|nr:helix-turn-helix domain-containing protein [Thermodesulfovibrio thiophilus]